jgi:hypothetical protein
MPSERTPNCQLVFERIGKVVFVAAPRRALPVRTLCLAAGARKRADPAPAPTPCSCSDSAKSCFIFSTVSHFSGRCLGLLPDPNATLMSTAIASSTNAIANPLEESRSCTWCSLTKKMVERVRALQDRYSALAGVAKQRSQRLVSKNPRSRGRGSHTVETELISEE